MVSKGFFVNIFCLAENPEYYAIQDGKQSGMTLS